MQIYSIAYLPTTYGSHDVATGRCDPSWWVGTARHARYAMAAIQVMLSAAGSPRAHSPTDGPVASFFFLSFCFVARGVLAGRRQSLLLQEDGNYPLPPAATRRDLPMLQARALQDGKDFSPLPFHDPFIPDETGKRAASLLPGRTASIRSTARSALVCKGDCANQVKAPLLAPSKWLVRPSLAHDNFGFFGSEIPLTSSFWAPLSSMSNAPRPRRRAFQLTTSTQRRHEAPLLHHMPPGPAVAWRPRWCRSEGRPSGLAVPHVRTQVHVPACTLGCAKVEDRGSTCLAVLLGQRKIANQRRCHVEAAELSGLGPPPHSPIMRKYVHITAYGSVHDIPSVYSRVASGTAIYPLHLGPTRALRALLLRLIYSLVFRPLFLVPFPDSRVYG